MNLHDEIEDELKEIAPHLSSVPKSHPFKVPSAYFEELEMKLISSINKQENREEIISSFPNEHPFNVPENYFNDLPSAILSKIIPMDRDEELRKKEIRTTSATTKKISDYKLWLAAASIAIVAVVSTALFMNHQPNKIESSNTTTENVTSDLLYASEVDDAMVVELYLQDQQQGEVQNSSPANVNDDNNFLRDVTDIDPYSISEM